MTLDDNLINEYNHLYEYKKSTWDNLSEGRKDFIMGTILKSSNWSELDDDTKLFNLELDDKLNYKYENPYENIGFESLPEIMIILAIILSIYK